MKEGTLSSKNLLSISELGREQLRYLLELTRSLENDLIEGATSSLAAKTIATLFWEDSTRTRLSFDSAVKRLSGQVLSLDKKGSSVSKGESIRDTAETLVSLGADCLIVRHQSSGVPQQISRWVDVPVINAGDGCNAHPTQALLDCYTIQNHFGNMEGLRILMIGDIAHSRVARSCIHAFKMLGADISISAPPTLIPPRIDSWEVEVAENLEQALETADVVYLLRVQKERQQEAFLPTLREYKHFYGLTSERAALLKDHTLIMHPGPINRGIEIDNEVADMDRAVVIEQVSNGVLVRMAVLYHLLAK